MSNTIPKSLSRALPLFDGSITDLNTKQLQKQRDKLTADDWTEILEYMTDNSHLLNDKLRNSLNTKVDDFANYITQYNLHDWVDFEWHVKRKSHKDWYTITWGLYTSALEVANADDQLSGNLLRAIGRN